MTPVLLATLTAVPLAAQGRLGVETFAGVMFDGYDARSSSAGALAGLRLGHGIGGRSRLVATAGLGLVNDVLDPSGSPDFYRKGNDWLVATVGIEHDLLRLGRRTAAAISLEGGAAFRRLDDEGVVGSPTFPDEFAGGGWSTYGALVAGTTLRRRFGARWEVSLTLRDHWLDLEEHSPAVTIGFGRR